MQSKWNGRVVQLASRSTASSLSAHGRSVCVGGNDVDPGSEWGGGEESLTYRGSLYLSRSFHGWRADRSTGSLGAALVPSSPPYSRRQAVLPMAKPPRRSVILPCCSPDIQAMPARFYGCAVTAMAKPPGRTRQHWYLLSKLAPKADTPYLHTLCTPVTLLVESLVLQIPEGALNSGRQGPNIMEGKSSISKD